MSNDGSSPKEPNLISRERASFSRIEIQSKMSTRNLLAQILSWQPACDSHWIFLRQLNVQTRLLKFENLLQPTWLNQLKASATNYLLLISGDAQRMIAQHSPQRPSSLRRCLNIVHKRFMFTLGSLKICVCVCWTNFVGELWGPNFYRLNSIRPGR